MAFIASSACIMIASMRPRVFPAEDQPVGSDRPRNYVVLQ